jgi:large subunit ribosomal protein L19
MIQTINFVPGDTVRVFEKVKEGDPSAGSGQVKTRLQAFEGVVLGIKGREENKTFMVRKMVGDVAVEKIWPISSPNVQKVNVKKHSKTRVRRAKLYYLRNTK